MVENIYALKNKIIQHVEKQTQDMNRIDVKELGELVDMVKDLAEAEKECWEASYYRKVTESMEQGSSGYGSASPGYNSMGRSGYGSQMRQGYSNQGSMGHSDIIEKLSEEFHNMNPEDRMMMKSKMLSIIGSA